MGFYVTEQADTPSENRVWGFSGVAAARASRERSNRQYPRRKNESTPTTTASGMRYYGYRFYSPELGRWLNRDPIEEMGGLNLYAFVDNAPLNDVDAFGLFCFWKWIKGRGAVWTCIPDPPQPDPNECLYDLVCDQLEHKQELWLWNCQCNTKCSYKCKLVHTGVCGDQYFPDRVGTVHPTETRTAYVDAGIGDECPDCPATHDGGSEWIK